MLSRSATLLLVGLGVLLASLAAAQETRLVEFEIEDQFKTKHSHEELAGRIVILAGGDQKGSEFVGAWEDAVREALRGSEGFDEIYFLPYADVRGVPFFLKGMVRGRFPKDPDSWVLIDWKGQLAKAYGMAKDSANLLLFSRDGNLVTRASGTDLDQAKIDGFAAIARELMAAGQ